MTVATEREQELEQQLGEMDDRRDELERKVAGLEAELEEVRTERDNLKNAIDRAKDQAHTLWYDLGNA